MKRLRLTRIKEIIAREVITTQDDLAEALKKEGFDITQATVSRDIKELGLVKIPAGNDTYRYSLPREGPADEAGRMRRIMTEAVLSLNFSENLVVIKALPGTAQGIAAVIDRSGWDEIIGTVAGDDTILVVVKPKEKVAQVIEKFQKFAY